MLLTLSSSLLVGWSVLLFTGHPFGEWVHLALFFAGVAFFVRVLMAASLSYSR